MRSELVWAFSEGPAKDAALEGERVWREDLGLEPLG